MSKPIDEHTLAYLAGCGISLPDLARYFSTTEDELVNQYGDLITKSIIDRNAELANNLYNMAMEGNVQAGLGWLKAQAGWDRLAKQEEKPTKDVYFNEIEIKVIEPSGKTILDSQLEPGNDTEREIN